MKVDHVDYSALDRAKLRFIEAARSTLSFAEKYGFVPDGKLGASANVFSLNLQPFIHAGNKNLYLSLLPEGLGTADDARPDDLNEEESQDFWHNIGIKTVSVMTNDAASAGLQSVLISLYMPTSNPEVVLNDAFLDAFLGGFVQGCKDVGCVYFSGETPQLKTKIFENTVDIAGAVFALCPAGMLPVDSSRLKAGDHIVFVQSSGPHENGFTSLRQIASELPQGYRTRLCDGSEYWRAINAGSVLYSALVQDIIHAGIKLTGIENITGHGWQKIMRSAEPFRYRISKILPFLPIFKFLNEDYGIPTEEMIRIFNCGVGMAFFVRSDEDAALAVVAAKKRGLNAVIAGIVEESDRREVVIEPLDITLSGDSFLLKRE